MTTGEDFIALAGQLAAGKNPTPIMLRTAINRAYYGAMHLTRQFLSSLGTPYEERHNLHHFLCNSGQREAEQAGKLLEGLLDQRMRADYKLDRPEMESLRFAQLAVEMAHEFRSRLALCSVEPALSEIRFGIEKYCEKTGRGKRK